MTVIQCQRCNAKSTITLDQTYDKTEQREQQIIEQGTQVTDIHTATFL